MLIPTRFERQSQSTWVNLSMDKIAAVNSFGAWLLLPE
jgi:hypothetical protein